MTNFTELRFIPPHSEGGFFSYRKVCPIRKDTPEGCVRCVKCLVAKYMDETSGEYRS